MLDLVSTLLLVLICAASATTDPSAIMSQLANSKPTGNQPIYIDTSSTCTKLYYSTDRVVENCSSLNLAVNWTVLNIDIHFVTELILSKNKFQTRLPSTEINQYDTLKLLDLSSNFIDEDTTDLQLIDCNINSFTEFILDDNLFRRVPLLNYNCMQKLERLSLRNNKQLVNFDDMATFTNAINPVLTTKIMSRLKFLDVSYCNIEQINENGFSILQYMPRLISLNLFGNRIRNIYANPFLSTPYLNYLSFEQNDVRCDSDIQWMKGYLTARAQTRAVCCSTEVEPPINPPIIDIIDPSRNYTPTCFSPLTLKNESIIDFPDDLFLIYINLTTTIADPTSISVVADDSLTLDCTVFSRPPSEIWWSFNDRILTRTTSAESPYEFIQSYDSTNTGDLLNKTSTLKIKRNKKELAGKYSCSAFYRNYEPNNYINIVSIPFNVNVEPNPNPPIVVGTLSSAEIAGIVLGSIFGFLLLCALIFCCVWCCCFSSSACCLPCCCCVGMGRRGKAEKNPHLVSSSSSDMRFAAKKVSELEESQSGFKDAQKVKPNYVINTISKGSNNYIRDEDCVPDSSISWKVLPNKNLTDITDLNTLHNTKNLNLISDEYRRTEFDTLNQLGHQHDLIDMHLVDDPAMISNTCNNTYSKYTFSNNNTLNKNQHRPQVYSTFNNPVDYGSTYNTNEAFLNDNAELNQVRFTTDVIIDHDDDHLVCNEQEHFEQYDSFNPNGLNNFTQVTRVYSPTHNHPGGGINNISSFAREVTNHSESLRNKQYGSTVNYNSNYIHEVNNTSFIKYDSDV